MTREPQRFNCYVCGPIVPRLTKFIEHHQERCYTAKVAELHCPQCGRLLRRVEDKVYNSDPPVEYDLGMKY